MQTRKRQTSSGNEELMKYCESLWNVNIGSEPIKSVIVNVGITVWNDFGLCWCLVIKIDLLLCRHENPLYVRGLKWKGQPLSTLDRVSIVPVTARVAVRVEPVLQVCLLGPLIQSLHMEQMLLGRDVHYNELKKRNNSRKQLNVDTLYYPHLQKWKSMHAQGGITKS